RREPEGPRAGLAQQATGPRGDDLGDPSRGVDRGGGQGTPAPPVAHDPDEIGRLRETLRAHHLDVWGIALDDAVVHDADRGPPGGPARDLVARDLHGRRAPQRKRIPDDGGARFTFATSEQDEEALDVDTRAP